MSGAGSNSRNRGSRVPDFEPLKQAIGNCVRAISGDREVEVSFTNDKPGMSGNEVRLPDLGKRLTSQQLAITRGTGDSMALRRACHDHAIHARYLPAGENARAIFDAVEQARVEAIGSRQMPGVAKNLSSMLEDKFSHVNYRSALDRADVPMEDAISLMVREKLTGMEVPQSARNIVDLWREHIEKKAGDSIARLDENLDDQAEFANGIRDLIAALRRQRRGRVPRRGGSGPARQRRIHRRR